MGSAPKMVSQDETGTVASSVSELEALSLTPKNKRQHSALGLLTPRIVLRDRVIAELYGALGCLKAIPEHLRALIAEFTDVQLQFVPQLDMPHIELSEIRRTVTNNSGSTKPTEEQQTGSALRCYHTVATNKWMQYGRHQMRLSLDALSTPSGVEIGVIGEDFSNWTGYIGFMKASFGWQRQKNLRGWSLMTGKGLEEGDAITVTLDADAGRVTYQINDDEEFVGFENIDQLPLKFAVSVWSGSRLTITE